MAKENDIIKELKELAEQLDIKVRFEKTNARGGLCQVNGKYHIIIDRNASKDYKINIMSDSLKKFDLDGMYLSPKIRELLDYNE